MSIEFHEEDVPHVLAVDDNLIDRKLVEKLLKISSCRAVTTAENGMRALEYLGLRENHQHGHINGKGSKVNMIITDYCMPGMTGYELLQKIKESSVLKDVPVVIMSSENIPNRINDNGGGDVEAEVVHVDDDDPNQSNEEEGNKDRRCNLPIQKSPTCKANSRVTYIHYHLDHYDKEVVDHAFASSILVLQKPTTLTQS
ncbi:hypothetical protein E3N88_03436 [Mikania micrantha]|uniref:Response regulatory domain-containing protein n=1 Tax=Mikania micrantha TaxID=192012 RepID=A0A5N6Q9E1_9ASTR|nr:hypothetical protein E3N88_03436 [Mikania micrantha]